MSQYPLISRPQWQFSYSAATLESHAEYTRHDSNIDKFCNVLIGGAMDTVAQSIDIFKNVNIQKPFHYEVVEFHIETCLNIYR